MNKQKIQLSFMATIAAVTIGYLGMKSFSHTENEYEALALQNIEALTDLTEELTPKGYFVFHMPQFNKYGQTTGRCSSTCSPMFESQGNSKTCHAHGNTYCCNQ